MENIIVEVILDDVSLGECEVELLDGEEIKIGSNRIDDIVKIVIKRL